MSRIEPVAWWKVNPAFAKYDGSGYVPVSHLWTDDPNTAADGTWLDVYTAEQIREMVKRVREELVQARPFPHPDAAQHERVYDAGGLAALDALLAQLPAGNQGGERG